MIKHTPGPWGIGDKTHYDNRKEDNGQAVYINAPQWGAFAKVVIQTKDGEGILSDKEIGTANARLIASAPELLKALKKIADNPCLDPEGNAEIAKQAIAKAEGD